jgi:putative nucleotidyltransferase with HDIG domain
MELAETVYIKTDSGKSYVVAEKGEKVNATMYSHLQECGVTEVDVYTASADAPGKKATAPKPAPKPEPAPEPKPEPKPEPVSKPEPPPEPARPRPPMRPENAGFDVKKEAPPVKSVIGDGLRKEATESIQEMFSIFTDMGEGNKTTAYQAINGFENVLTQVVDAVTQDSSGLIHIHDLKSYDEYTYHHSLSVAMLAVATGQQMGLLKSDLIKLSRSAMLHDIGKQTVPLEIINKPGKLSDKEFETVKAHPITGAQLLKAKAMGDLELWSAVMFHHEKYDGSGYPKGLKAEQIPVFSRIIAVADVYDAITSFRSYREPMTPAHAYEVICSQVGSSFDYEVVKAFTDRLELYPISTAIELSDGRIGIVIGNESPMRPVLKIWGTGETVDLSSVKHLTLLINRVIHPNDAPWEI